MIDHGAKSTYGPRVEARAELLKRLQTWNDRRMVRHRLLQPLGEFWDAARTRNAPEASSMPETLLTHAPPIDFLSIARRSGLPSERIRAYFLAKQVTTPPDKRALADNLAALQDEVVLSIYVDPEVTAKHGALPVPPARESRRHHRTNLPENANRVEYRWPGDLPGQSAGLIRHVRILSSQSASWRLDTTDFD